MAIHGGVKSVSQPVAYPSFTSTPLLDSPKPLSPPSATRLAVSLARVAAVAPAETRRTNPLFSENTNTLNNTILVGVTTALAVGVGLFLTRNMGSAIRYMAVAALLAGCGARTGLRIDGEDASSHQDASDVGQDHDVPLITKDVAGDVALSDREDIPNQDSVDATCVEGQWDYSELCPDFRIQLFQRDPLASLRDFVGLSNHFEIPTIEQTIRVEARLREVYRNVPDRFGPVAITDPSTPGLKVAAYLQGVVSFLETSYDERGNLLWILHNKIVTETGAIYTSGSISVYRVQEGRIVSPVDLTSESNIEYLAMPFPISLRSINVIPVINGMLCRTERGYGSFYPLTMAFFAVDETQGHLYILNGGPPDPGIGTVNLRDRIFSLTIYTRRQATGMPSVGATGVGVSEANCSR